MTTMAIDNKDKKVLNVPHLRFPEFTEEWVNVSLKDVADFQKERISSGLLDESTYISTENILQNFQGVQSAISIPANTNVVAYKKNDILLSNIRPYLKKVWFSDRIGGCSADVFVLRSKTCEPEFLYNVIASDKFINYVMSGAKGVKMPRGDKNQMESFSFSIPAVVEQRKISRLFQLLDERIVTQNKIIEDLKKLKSAIIDQLYSAIKGKGYSYRQIFEIVNERNKQLEYSNILSASQEKGMVNREDLNLDIQFERSNINTYKVVRKGDYVIHLRSFQGGYAFSDKIGVCSPAYTILRPNDLLEFRYLSYYFTSQKFIKSLIIVTYGIRDGRSINVEEWLDMKTTIPQKEQQRHIVDTIRNIEKKIENEELYASYLSKQKQYLLRQLFI